MPSEPKSTNSKPKIDIVRNVKRMSPKMESEMMGCVLVCLFDFKRPLINALPTARHPVITNAKIRIAHFQLYLLSVERSSSGMMMPPTEVPMTDTRERRD